MPKIEYRQINFHESVKVIIRHAMRIVDKYAGMGYDLTLRQLYYQFVSEDLLPNTIQSYKRLGSIINDARLAGLIDWDRIKDNTRELQGRAHWLNPADRIRSAIDNYAIDLWSDQDNRVEVWVEKDALAQVVGRTALKNDVDYFACKGYTSQSEMWAAAQRHIEYIRNGQQVHIIHLGDHDPSGIDMSRDVFDRLQEFVRYEGLEEPEIHRIALNMNQVNKYKPPPNPAKVTDSRAKKYIQKYGDNSWELDALSPDVIASLIQKKIDELRDAEQFNARIREQESGRKTLEKLAKQAEKDEE